MMSVKGGLRLALGVAILAGAAYGGRDHLRAAIEPVKADKAAPDQPGRQGAAPNKSGGKQQGRGGPAPVTAALAREENMPVILTAPGSVEALATVAVRPRVDGQIVEVPFKEGDLVEDSQVLFRLDDRLIKAQIRQAEANIARDEASLRDAMSTLDRREALATKKYVSEAAAETARHTVEGLKASIDAGRAQLEMQRTQLDYLVIRAPITGRTGSIGAKLGATVRANDPVPLVVINQTQPIAISFSVPQTELGSLRRALSARSTAEIRVQGERPLIVQGTMGMIDNQVDRATGTIQAKVIAQNHDEALWPGQAVEVALTVELRPKVISVPASAVLPAQQGMLAWVIGPDLRVEPRTVVVERIVGQTAFLQSGLKVGERVVTDGQLRLAPGATVKVLEYPGPNTPPASSARRTDGRT